MAGFCHGCPVQLLQPLPLDSEAGRAENRLQGDKVSLCKVMQGAR